MTKKDYYEILSLSKNASKEEIKKAYKVLAKKYHPDVSKEHNASERFKEISEAYAVLSDDSKKSTYDQFGHAGFDQRYSREDMFRGADFSSVFEEIFGNSDSNGFDDIFSSFFSTSRRRRSKGNDLQYKLAIDFEEAAFGTEKSINVKKYEHCNKCNGTGAKNEEYAKCHECDGKGQITRTQRTPFGMFSQTTYCSYCKGQGEVIKNPCNYCNGNGIIRANKEITVKVPAGIDQGQILRVRSEGESIKSGQSGDLYVVIDIRPHKIFERDGNDIYLEMPITFSQATLSTELEVPTLKGNSVIKIPESTQTGTIFRLTGKGINNGDQYVRIVVKTPTKINAKQRKLFEELGKESNEKLKISKGFFDKVKEVFKE